MSSQCPESWLQVLLFLLSMAVALGRLHIALCGDVGAKIILKFHGMNQ
jgi:hypothetical protein